MQSDLAMWSLIVGFLTPIVTSLFIQSSWTSGAKAVVNFIVAAIAGIGTVYFEGNVDFNHVTVSTVLFCIVTSIASYHGLLRPTGVAPAVEAKTNFSKP